MPRAYWIDAVTSPENARDVRSMSAPDAGPSLPDVSLDGFATKPVLVVAVGLFALEMALAGRYGFHRDELYFLDCARHLQLAYVDQPILTPLLVRLSLSLFGVSLYAIRFWSALAVAATVMVGALLAREFGGGRQAQVLAAITVATMPVLLAAGHTMGTTPIDILAWSTLALVVARIGRTGNPRLWLVAGVVLGLGLANKHSIAFLAVVVVVGALLSGGPKLVLNRWFLLGALIAAAFATPDLWWQATHGWPTIAMTRSLNQENGGLGNVGNWFVGQLLMTSVVFIWVWVLGLRFLWRSGGPLWRSLVWAYGHPLRLLRADDGRKDLLPGRRVRLPARSRFSRRRTTMAKQPSAGAAPVRVGGPHDDHRDADGAARAARVRHRLDLQGQPGPGRGSGLARVGAFSEGRVVRPAAE